MGTGHMKMSDSRARQDADVVHHPTGSGEQQLQADADVDE